MKKTLLAISCLAFISVKAQTAEEIIQRYIVAMGGLESVNKIETVKITGTLTSQGKNYPLTIQIVNGKQMRSDVDVNGQIVINAYDKGKGWKINTFENINTATEVTAPDDLALLKTQSYLANNLMDYKKRGNQVEMLGQEDVEGVKTYKIKLTSKDDGKVTTYYISSTDYMLIRSDSKQKIQNNDYDAATYYSDIRDMKGLKFSMHFIRKIGGTVFQEVKYAKVEMNVPVDEKVFKMPK